MAVAALAIAVVATAILAATAAAATPGPPVADVLGIGGALKDLLDKASGVLIGGVNWTSDVAGEFIVQTLGGLVDLLIPDSWAGEATSIMRWVVAVPNYGAQVTTPGGSAAYAFAGINELRDLFVWIGLALLPLTLVYASTRAMFGLGDHVALPVIRVLGIGVVLVSYPWLWGQVAAIVNQITKAILSVPLVSSGITKLFELIVQGAGLAGLPLVGLIVMGAAGVALLATIFVKVLMIIVGALVYATGPVMLGLAPTERGAAAARAWLTLALGLAALPVVWTTVFAIAGLLMNDSAGAGALIGTDSDLGELLGGLLLAMAAIAAFWLNLKLTRLAAAMLGGQVAGMLALASSGRSGGAIGVPVASNARDALSAFSARVGGAVRGAAGPLAGSGRAGGMLVRAGGGVATLAGGGLIGAAGGLAKRGAAGASGGRLGQAIGGTKAGALATRMARAGYTGWKAAARQPDVSQANAGGHRAEERRPTGSPPPPETAAPRRDWRPPSRPAGDGEPARERSWRWRWRWRGKGGR
ncbi:MAG: hypothetical protein ACR2H2_01215 [Solirubrobacteraceae bacterium]